MATFHFQALDAGGNSVAGNLDAASIQQALAELENRGLVLQSIGVVPTPARPSAINPSNAKDVLRSHMGIVLERGRGILPALEAYAEELPGGHTRRQVESVCRVLRSGDTEDATAGLVESPEYWIPMLSATTSSTEPGQVLDTFLSESRQTDEIRQQWWLTLAYPIGMACLALLVFVGLSVFVIPEFGKIFLEFDVQTPALTRVVIEIAKWLASWQALAFAVLVVSAVGLWLRFGRRFPAARLAWWCERLRLPFGRRSTVARFSRFMADLLDAGLTMPDALRIAGFTVDHSRLQHSAWQLASELEISGKYPARIEPLPLTTSVYRAVSTEMAAPTRVKLLREIASNHAERVRIGISWASGIVEPLGILFVGFMIGLVVVALFLPLVMLIEGLSG